MFFPTLELRAAAGSLTATFLQCLHCDANLTNSGWLPSCLTHRSYSNPLTFVANCLQATYAGNRCQNKPATARSHPGCASRASAGNRLFRQLVRNPGAHPRPHDQRGAAGVGSPPTKGARYLNNSVSPAPNGIHCGMDKVAGWEKRISGGPAGFFAGKGRLGDESFHFQHPAANQRISHVGSILNRGNVMHHFLSRLWSDQEGQDIAEYSVMLAVILVIVVSTVRLIGSNAGNVFSV